MDREPREERETRREPREESRGRSMERPERPERGGRGERSEPLDETRPFRRHDDDEAPEATDFKADDAPMTAADDGGPESAPAEVPKPANWDRMDDIERRLWLRENGQAPAPASRSDDGRGRRR
jgi:hypothetical protein